MNTEKNCQSCKYYKDGYCKELELNPHYPEQACDYFSRQNRLKKDAISKNAYKQGWCDALAAALKEAHTIHSEEGNFQVIQAETLMGLGHALDDFKEESDG